MERSNLANVKKSAFTKGRQLDEQALAEVRELLGNQELRRDLLIEFLHLIQDHYGCVKAAHMNALASEMRLSQAEVYEVASFYHHFDIVKEGDAEPAPITIRVCDSLSCELAGSKALEEALKAGTDPSQVRVVHAPCMGACDVAPAVSIGKKSVGNATVENVLSYVTAGDTKPVIPDYTDLDAYKAEGGYALFEKVRSGDVTGDDLIATLSDAGLKGLGGAGFPAGRKWGFVKSYEGPRLMTINGDEGEPGTFKDRHYLGQDPHRMLEGALIAAHAVEAERIYIYLRDEYPEIAEVLKAEIAKLDEAGLTREVGFELRRGAGAYICGEESAMLESIEGKRGLPRHRPPYIAEVGLFGRPTLNHNVETLWWIRDIVEKGADWFASLGTNGSTGNRSYSVSGRVKNPGVVLTAAGSTARDLIEACGGMVEGHTFKAYLPGGPSGGILPESLGDEPLDFGTINKYGAFVGSHAVVILSDQDNIKDAALNLLRFFEYESCGQCTPCRAGTEKMVKLLEENELDEDLINELSDVMRDASICGLGQAAPNPVGHLLKYFAEDYK
ncbi:NAD(P)H-dependent oxidoreductase subunit E [Coralliovum pocilloporae]|uniref:NAD(P)H-dependent oxidoreductase subunit E n=1 Tax=Coralliovum pocilloporae TaxID=3066369 RepID=UPI003D9C4650